MSGDSISYGNLQDAKNSLENVLIDLKRYNSELGATDQETYEDEVLPIVQKVLNIDTHRLQ